MNQVKHCSVHAEAQRKGSRNAYEMCKGKGLSLCALVPMCYLPFVGKMAFQLLSRRAVTVDKC